MKIEITRHTFLPNCTIGHLVVVFDTVKCVLPIYVCDTLEPHTIDWETEQKVDGKTSIPCGEYETEFAYSKKFAKNMLYLKNVPHFEGVMIHTGNSPKDTRGCILVGTNPRPSMDEILPKLIDSRIKYNLLWKLIVRARANDEKITILVKEDRR